MTTPQGLQVGVPVTPQMPMVDAKGIPTKPWYSFFVALWQRTGGANASVSPILDLITANVGALLYRGGSVWQGLSIGTVNQALISGAATPAWAFLSGDNFDAEPANEFLIGPATGADAQPTFRKIVTSDLANVAGAIPGTTSSAVAASGNVGQLINSNIPVGSAVALTSTVAADVTDILVRSGDWDVWATIALTGTGVISSFNAWISTTSATDPGAPNSGAYLSASALISAAPIGLIRAGVGGGGQNYYLSVNATFTGTISAYGFIEARRAR